MELCKFSPELIKRREPEELVLRFFAYQENRKNFKHDVASFLDDYLEKNKDRDGTDKEKKQFKDMLNFVLKYFPDGFAKKGKNQTPRVRFEAISIGVAEALAINPRLVPNHVTSWLESEEFEKEVSTHASNSTKRLNSRISFVKKHLLTK